MCIIYSLHVELNVCRFLSNIRECKRYRNGNGHEERSEVHSDFRVFVQYVRQRYANDCEVEFTRHEPRVISALRKRRKHSSNRLTILSKGNIIVHIEMIFTVLSVET